MSTIKSSAENLTLNADGANNDIKFQSNGSEVASIDQAGLLTATSFAGSGANLTGIPTPTNVTANAFDFGNWTITETSGVLYFATGGTNKMKLDASGNLTCVGNVTAYGTM
jgi:hypothetical protein